MVYTRRWSSSSSSSPFVKKNNFLFGIVWVHRFSRCFYFFKYFFCFSSLVSPLLLLIYIRLMFMRSLCLLYHNTHSIRHLFTTFFSGWISHIAENGNLFIVCSSTEYGNSMMRIARFDQNTFSCFQNGKFFFSIYYFVAPWCSFCTTNKFNRWG